MNLRWEEEAFKGDQNRLKLFGWLWSILVDIHHFFFVPIMAYLR